MSYAVVHMMKLHSGSVRGIQSHNQREKEPHTNPDIDKSRTYLNYDLLNMKNINYHKAIKERVKNFAPNTKTVRKDAVVLCNFIVTSDEKTMKSMTPTEQKSFFKDVVSFFEMRYGEEKLVNATIHLDETTPHIHIGLVPITKDGRLSAKSLFNKTELRNLQTDFAEKVGKKYGLERGIEGSERTHLSEQQFKTKMAIEQEQKTRDSLFKAQKELEGIKYSFMTLNAEYEAKKAYISQIIKDCDPSVMYPKYAKIEERGLFQKEKYVTIPLEHWESQHIAINHIDAVKKEQKVLENILEELKNNNPNVENKKLIKQNKELKQEIFDLKQTLKTAFKDIESVNNFMKQHPDIKDSFEKQRNVAMEHTPKLD